MKQKKLRQIFCVLLGLLLLLVMSGCGNSSSTSSSSSSSSSSSVETPPSSAESAESVEDELFTALKGKKFTFASGAGGWETNIEMKENGKFSGIHVDGDLGETGKGYPDGTYHVCEFTGQFTSAQKKDDYSYGVKLENLKTSHQEDEEEIKNNIKIIYAGPYGFESGKDYEFYTADCPRNQLSETFLGWISADPNSSEGGTLSGWGLYNVEEEYGMFENPDAVMTFDPPKSTKKNDSEISDLYKYIYKTGNDVISDFGDDYVRETYEGADGIDYRDQGIWFFLWEYGFDKPVGSIAVSESYDIGFGLNSTMTFKEIPNACNKLGVKVEKPVKSYNELDDYTEFNTSFKYKGYRFEYFWDEDDNAEMTKSEGVWIYGLKYFDDPEPDDPVEPEDSNTITEAKAIEIAIKEAESNPDNQELKVYERDVRIYDKNSDAYIVFVPVLDEYDAGYTDVIWVNAKTGEAKHIDGVQEEFPGMYDVSTGAKLY